MSIDVVSNIKTIGTTKRKIANKTVVSGGNIKDDVKKRKQIKNLLFNMNMDKMKKLKVILKSLGFIE